MGLIYHFKTIEKEFDFKVLEIGGMINKENKIPSGLFSYEGFIILGLCDELPKHFNEFVNMIREKIVDVDTEFIVGITPEFESWEISNFVDEDEKLNGIKFKLKITYNSFV